MVTSQLRSRRVQDLGPVISFRCWMFYGLPGWSLGRFCPGGSIRKACMHASYPSVAGIASHCPSLARTHDVADRCDQRIILKCHPGQSVAKLLACSDTQVRSINTRIAGFQADSRHSALDDIEQFWQIFPPVVAGWRFLLCC